MLKYSNCLRIHTCVYANMIDLKFSCMFISLHMSIVTVHIFNSMQYKMEIACERLSGTCFTWDHLCHRVISTKETLIASQTVTQQLLSITEKQPI